MKDYSTGQWDLKLREEGFVFDVDSLYEYLERVKDYRKVRGVRYALVKVLVLVLLAKLAGEDHLRGMAEWVALRQAELCEALGLSWKRMPHHTTYSRILGWAINRLQFEEIVRDFFASRPPAAQGLQIAIDGKAMCGTIAVDPQRSTYLLAAYQPEQGFTLMQVEIAQKENEIVAAPRVLKCLNLQGKVVTGDAMFAQRKLSQPVVEAGGDYIWIVKDNQSDLRQEIEALFELGRPQPGQPPVPTDFRTATTLDKGHGRIEQRTITVSSLLKDYLRWPYQQQVFRVERQVYHIRTQKQTQEVVYGITSLSAPQAAAAQLLDAVRDHWGIENGLHYRRDVTLQEDACHLRTGYAAHVMAIINNLVLGLVLGQGLHNVPSARRAYAANWLNALALITH